MDWGDLFRLYGQVPGDKGFVTRHFTFDEGRWSFALKPGVRAVLNHLRLEAEPEGKKHYSGHSHRFLELILVMKGHGFLYHSGHRTTLAPGNLYFCDYEESHRHRGSSSGPPLELLILNFDPQLCFEWSGNFAAPLDWRRDLAPFRMARSFPKPMVRLGGADLLRTAVLLLQSGRAAREAGAAAGALGRALEHLLSEVSRFFQEDYPDLQPASPVGSAAQEYLAAHSQTKVNLGSLARALRISRSYLVRRFTRDFDISPMAYLSQIRASRAADLLTHTLLPVARIGLEVGFESQAAFYRCFQKSFGMSPGQWRLRG